MGAEVGIPNRFIDPVCCATRGLIDSGEPVFSGANAGRGGTGKLFTGFCGEGGVAIVVIAFAVVVRMATSCSAVGWIERTSRVERYLLLLFRGLAEDGERTYALVRRRRTER